MKIFITGASGLVGTALGSALERDGHVVLRATRSRATGPNTIAWDPAAGRLDAAALKGIDAVVNLAGENIGSGRWTPAKKKALLESRTLSTKLIAETIAALDPKPRVFLSASASGFYGNRRDEWLDEGSAMGEGFLAEICRDWEAETRAAQRAGIRTVQLRFGVVLSRHGGALARMLTPFRLGLGGRLGDGRQFFSFVAIRDAIAAIRFALETETLSGPVNVVAPEPVTNAEFTRALGRALRRPTIFPAPAFGIRLALGEMGQALLLDGQRVRPKRLLDAGFRFEQPTIDSAIAAALREN
jgi:uncharacterized protein